MIDSFKTLARRHGNSGLLLDANLFVLWIVGNVDKKLITEHRKTTDYRIEHFAALEMLLGEFKKIYTSPYILSEVSNLVKAIKQPYRTQMLDALRSILQLENVAEAESSARVTCMAECFMSLGLTDAAIVEYPDKNVLVVTDDNPLIGKLQKLKRAFCSIKRIEFQSTDFV